ncbi:hypothetical protein FSP39_007377 [Pinctada imbricata]|uniref:Uracil-DNA glycosylase-like domain-containing protein n=1 Tax=Pinctada imbricata TaxID=66713 RepID=A0AA88YUJ6_PINIB|nr:hypothetical protein FSP39_007377 [Pinctada imbricata]
MDGTWESSFNYNHHATEQLWPQGNESTSNTGNGRPSHMLNPNSATGPSVNSCNHVPFFSDGSNFMAHSSTCNYNLSLLPGFADTGTCGNQYYPSINPSVQPQRFLKNIVSQFNSQDVDSRYLDQDGHSSTHGGGSVLSMTVPNDLMQSNSMCNVREVRQGDCQKEENLWTKKDNSYMYKFSRQRDYEKEANLWTKKDNSYMPRSNQGAQAAIIYANEWDLLSESVTNSEVSGSQSQDIPTIMNYMLGREISLNLTIPERFLIAERRQCESMKGVTFYDPISYVYNPLVYAFEAHRDFVMKYCCLEKDILFLGMNPGPFGMVQNGVPFGEIRAVTEWLNIEGMINQPKHQHPKRPILGWSSTRSEISGKRFWGLFQKLCGRPDNFFCRCFVHNYCPLAFLGSSGKNVTQPELPMETRKRLNNICDDSLLEILCILNVKLIICLGRFVETSVKRVLKNNNLLGSIRIETLSHPSPLNRTAHSGWEPIAMQQLTDMGVIQYFNTFSNENP